ncbi:DUF2062 domain-containing protein [Endozoicomonadaceae bacterium StTr2]
MAKKLIKRYMPDPEKIRGHKSLRFLGRFLHDANLWHFNRRSVASAFFLGIFTAFIPIPFQMVVAAVLALVFRANVALSVALVWITNPLTMPPMFYFTYKVGCLLLNTPVNEAGFEMSLDWLTTGLQHIWKPLYLGSIVCGLIFGSLSYVLIRVYWRIHVIRSWRARINKRFRDSAPCSKHSRKSH